MKDKYFTIEVKVAITAIIAIILLFFGMKFLKGIDIFKSTRTYYITFSDVTGLAKSNPVYAGGFAVGNVKDIIYDYNNPGNIVVQIELDKKMKIPAGTSAELLSTMLGGVNLNLLLNNGAQDFLHAGDTISGRMHLGALDKAETMIPAFEKLLPKLDSILATVNVLVADPSIRETLHNLDDLSRNLNESSQQLTHLLKYDVPRVTANLNEIGHNTSRFTSNLADLNLQATLDSVNNTVNEVNRLTASLNGKLNSKDNSLGMLLSSRALHDSLTAVSGSANALLMDLKSHPKRYVHFSVFGKKDK
jgi:phospholipid/cholesterol/gamma-HCH transport system substrate-binding protein